MSASPSVTPPILIIPGWGDSGPEHWQTLWETAFPNARRVTQRDWEKPARADWVLELDRAIASCLQPPVLVAHSLGCLAVAHWADANRRPVASALLVAPSDPERREFPPTITGFAPVPTVRLPFPSILVASANDPFIRPERAKVFADAWGSRFVDAGRSGHINAASGFGPWPAGETLLGELVDGRR